MNTSILEKVKSATLAMQRYSWEQGTVAQAFLESGDTSMAILMAVEGANRQTADGRCSQIGDPVAVTDPCCIGEPLIYACEQTKDSNLIHAKDLMLKWALEDAPRNSDGVIYHLTTSPQIWSDSFYMLPPTLARAGYYEEALHQIDGYWNILLDPEKNLLSHQWDDRAEKFIRKDVWGVGNGWAAAGMTRIAAILPPEYTAQKFTLTQRIRTLLNAALPLQRTDGLFYDILDDPTSFPEINSGQMFAYSIYQGVKGGWLSDSYLDPAERIYHTAQKQIDSYGLVHNVCGMPTFDKPGTAPEGQAFYILMDAARTQLGIH